MSRNVNVLVGVELDDFVEVEVVDYDNRNANYQLWRHSDDTYTLALEIDRQKIMFRRTGDAMRELLTGILGRLDTLTPREEPQEFVSWTAVPQSSSDQRAALTAGDPAVSTPKTE